MTRLELVNEINDNWNCRKITPFLYKIIYKQDGKVKLGCVHVGLNNVTLVEVYVSAIDGAELIDFTYSFEEFSKFLKES